MSDFVLRHLLTAREELVAELRLVDRWIDEVRGPGPNVQKQRVKKGFIPRDELLKMIMEILSDLGQAAPVTIGAELESRYNLKLSPKYVRGVLSIEYRRGNINKREKGSYCLNDNA